jgi:hypothetical protein
MNKYTNILLGFILVVVLINLTFTRSVYIRQIALVNAMTDSTERLDSKIAKLWGEKVVNMYNQQDHQALYAIFNEQAKVKISYQQL